MARDQELSVKLTGDATGLTKATNTAAKSLTDLNKQVDKVDANSIDITADVDLQRVNRDMASLNKILDGLERRRVDPDVDMDLTQVLKDEAKVRKALNELDQRRVTIEAGIEVDPSGAAGVESSLGGIKDAAISVGTALAGWKLVTVAADVETTKISLSSLTGSAEAGAAAFKDLQAFAAKTPYELDQVTTAARSLLAAGVEANELPEMLTDIGNAASAVSAPLDEVALVFQQMFAKGKISNEELLQLAEKQVPAYQALADAMGVTTAEIQTMAEKGQLGADKITLLSTALGDMFPTSMEDQANSLNGQLSTLGDNVTQLAGNIGAILLPPVKDLVGALNDALGPVADLTGKFEQLPGPVKEVAGDFAAIATVVGGAAFFGPKVIGGIIAAKTAMDGLGVSAVSTAGKLKMVGTGLAIGAAIIGIQLLDDALTDLTNARLDTGNVDQELLGLANSGKVSGEMAKTFGDDLSGLTDNLKEVGDTALQTKDFLLGWAPGSTEVELAEKNIQGLDQAMANLVDSGHADEAAAAYKRIVAAAKEQGISAKDVAKNFDTYQLALDNATEAEKKEKSATEQMVEAHLSAADAAKQHAEDLQELTRRAEESQQKYLGLKDAFTTVNDAVVDSRSAIYDYQGSLDALAESMSKGSTFSPDLEQGRANWDALVGVANGAAAVVESTWKEKGAAAAVAVATQQRKSMAQILIDAGTKAPQAWNLVNQVFKTPVKIKIALSEVAFAKAQTRLRKLQAQQEALRGARDVQLADPKTAGTQAARDVAAGFAEQMKPMDAKIKAATTNVKESRQELNSLANPKGKGRTAGIKATVQGETAAKTTLDNLAVDRYAYIYTRVMPAPSGAPGAPPQAGPRLALTGLSPTPLAGLQAVGATMAAPAALPYYAPRPSGAAPTAPGGTTVRMAPRQTPVAVYLDGAEIADRLDARRSLAAVESVRRTA